MRREVVMQKTGIVAVRSFGWLVLAVWGGWALTCLVLSSGSANSNNATRATGIEGETSYAYMPALDGKVVVVRHVPYVASQWQSPTWREVTKDPAFSRWYHQRVFHWRSDCPLLLRQRHDHLYRWSSVTLLQATQERAIPCVVCANADDLVQVGMYLKL
jgi:hypothetical protein